MSIEFPDCVQVKKTLYNYNTQAAATAGNILKFLIIKSSNFPLLFTFCFRIDSTAG